MNYRKALFFTGLIIASLQLHAQSTTATITTIITGKVTDSTRKPLEGATVILLNDKDSTVAKTTLSADNGVFSFEKIRYGNYKITVSLTGFAKYTSDKVSVTADHSSIILDPFVINQQTNRLQDVTVTSQRPLVERKIDRTVVNVDAMITAAGSTAFEVLEKAPGVSVDQNGVVSLKGKSGVVIFIDDKPTYLSGADLESYLRSLPSSTIDQIELITNPPAKYDAAGGAGVINIRTKRTRIKGFNGTVIGSVIQGKYTRTNNNFNFNYRNNKLNMFGLVTYNSQNGFTDLNINRYFKNPDGSRKSDFIQNTMIRPGASAFTAKLGADYYANDKTTFGIVLTGVSRTGQRNNDNDSRIFNANSQLDSTIVAHNTQENFFRNGGVNLNFRHQYKKNGPELTADADYISYKTGNDQLFDNYTYQPNGILSYHDKLSGNVPASISIWSGKVDYSHPLSIGWKLETGVKSSHTETDNVAEYFYTANNITSPDYDKTNHFIYKETIHAAYINASREGKRWSYQFGLRGEHTISDGRQLGNAVKPDSSFRRTYTNLFPTAYISYKLDSSGNNVLSLNYGKRIERPYYQDLNPFISPLDKFTYYTGNPFLQPAFTHNIELSYGFRSYFTITASYSRTLNSTNETIEIVNGTYYSRPGNIGKVTNMSLSLDGNVDLAKWLAFHLYTEVTNIHATSDFYTGLLDTKGTFWYAQPNLQFKLGKGWNAQADAVYQTRLTNNQFVLLPRGRVNAGFSKKISAASTLRVNVNDLFYTSITRGIINNLALTEANWRNASDSRFVSISLSYRFGKAMNDLRKHNGTGAESEKNRVKD
jgi:hypothetical protein